MPSISFPYKEITSLKGIVFQNTWFVLFALMYVVKQDATSCLLTFVQILLRPKMVHTGSKVVHLEEQSYATVTFYQRWGQPIQ
jgi:hypothetical protein